MSSFAVRNFGCRVNQAEAFAWAEAFRERGLRLDEDWGRSDVLLVNSCTLTRRADRDVRRFIEKAARDNPATRIVVTGCYAERAPDEVAGMPNVVAVVPNAAKGSIPQRLLELGGPAASSPGPGAARPFRARASLKIQDGCDRRCAFCVIPSVRGRSVSLEPGQVLASARTLAGRGFKELVLAGIHLSSYGGDLEPRGSLLGVLREVEAVPGLGRVRLSSLDPGRTDAALVAHIASSPKICPHFHLSLQHASARVLRLMGRPARPDRYEGLLVELRRRAPDAALGADIIAGFPGETEADFVELRDFLERAPLTYFHVFSFSPRKGTPAAARRPLPDGVVTARAAALRRLSMEKDLRFRGRFVGRTLEAVVIRKTGRGAEALTGNSIRVCVPSCPVPERELVRVAIRRVMPGRTEGEVPA